MNLIGGLAADVGRAGGPRGLWVLTPDNGQHTLPTLNGAPIPITSPNQHTRLTSACNASRSNRPSSTTQRRGSCATSAR